MKTFLTKKNALIALVVAIVMVTGGSLIFHNKQLKNDLSQEKLRWQNLFSQKQQLDKSLEVSIKSVAVLQGKNSSMENIINEINQKITLKNIEIEKLKSQNSSLKNLQKKIDELEILKKQKDQEIVELNKSLTDAQSENSKFNDKVAAAVKANSNLSADNSILKAMVSDNYRTEALRGRKEKLTVNARKTNKLMVSFDMPGSTHTNDIYFKVFTPEGNEFSSDKDITATISFADKVDHLMASADNSAYGPAEIRRVEMTFNPKQKLTKGVYRFNLYNGNRFLGSTQLRLK